ncbi:MAG TPA: DUF6702 family protein [Gemmatimonadaceae bacterium]
MVARCFTALGATALLLCAAARVVDAHPLHTTITEVVATPQTIRATVRLFADDLSQVLSRRAVRVASDSVVGAYVGAAFSILDGAQRMLPTRSCGVRRADDVVWVCLEARVTGPLEQLMLRNTIFADAFNDQVNIVRGTSGRSVRTVLFMRGDGAKRLF